jgi:hypothetical protein
MKKLFENWRGFINERTTDDVYAELLKLAKQAFSDPSNFEGLDQFILDTAIWNDPDLPRDEFPPDITFRLRPETVAKYVDLAKKIPNIEKVLPDDRQLQALFSILFQVVYMKNRPSMRGAFNASQGRIFINMAHPSHHPLFGSTGGDYNRIMVGDLLEFITDNTTTMPQTIDHEFTHLINFVRSIGSGRMAQGLDKKIPRGVAKAILDKMEELGVRHRASGTGRDDEIIQAIRYANSYDEVQARLQHIFKDAKGYVASKQKGQEPSFKPLAASEQNNRAREVFEEITEIIMGDSDMPANEKKRALMKSAEKLYNIYYPSFLIVSTKRTKTRLKKRFFEFAEDMLNLSKPKQSLKEYVVPMGYSLKAWKAHRKKHKITNAQWHKENPGRKWKVVHGHKKGEIGEPVNDKATNMSYEAANKMHAAIAISQGS